jgi:hypothetical protein
MMACDPELDAVLLTGGYEPSNPYLFLYRYTPGKPQ